MRGLRPPRLSQTLLSHRVLDSQRPGDGAGSPRVPAPAFPSSLTCHWGHSRSRRDRAGHVVDPRRPHGARFHRPSSVQDPTPGATWHLVTSAGLLPAGTVASAGAAPWPGVGRGLAWPGAWAVPRQAASRRRDRPPLLPALLSRLRRVCRALPAARSRSPLFRAGDHCRVGSSALRPRGQSVRTNHLSFPWEVRVPPRSLLGSGVHGLRRRRRTSQPREVQPGASFFLRSCERFSPGPRELPCALDKAPATKNFSCFLFVSSTLTSGHCKALRLCLTHPGRPSASVLGTWFLSWRSGGCVCCRWREAVAPGPSPLTEQGRVGVCAHVCAPTAGRHTCVRNRLCPHHPRRPL